MADRTEQVLVNIPHKRINNAKVLIVVDKYVSGKTLRNVLEEWRYDVIGVCTSSQEALVRIKKDKPDLILTDVALDHCDVIYLAQQLNSHTDNTKALD